MTYGTSYWSDEARSRHKHRTNWARQHEMDRKYMMRGPYLDDDGHTLIIPGGSGFYIQEAAQFWGSKGFRWDPDTVCWSRDIRAAIQGKLYSAASWLESARRKFFEFYPALVDAEDTPQGV